MIFKSNKLAVASIVSSIVLSCFSSTVLAEDTLTSISLPAVVHVQQLNDMASLQYNLTKRQIDLSDETLMAQDKPVLDLDVTDAILPDDYDLSDDNVE